MIVSIPFAIKDFDAFTAWPFIFIEKAKRNNAALIAHEMVHYERQAWITPVWLVRYWLSNDFRFREEVLGYKAQIKEGGITQEGAAKMLEKYNAGRTFNEALEALQT